MDRNGSQTGRGKWQTNKNKIQLISNKHVNKGADISVGD